MVAANAENSSAHANSHHPVSHTYTERLQRLKEMSKTRKPTSVLTSSNRQDAIPRSQVSQSPQKVEAMTVGPKQALKPTVSEISGSGSVITALDSVAERLEAELHLCDISLNQLQSSLVSTKGAAPTQSVTMATRMQNQQGEPLMAPQSVNKDSFNSHPNEQDKGAPVEVSLVKKLLFSTGQGCQSVLAPSITRQPIPGVYWTTRTIKGAPAKSSCTLLLCHAASTDLIVRLTVADSSSVPERVLVSTAPKSTATFEVLGEVQLAPGSHRHIRHVFRLSPGTIAGRCLRLDLVGRQVDRRGSRSSSTVAHRVSNILVTGHKVDLEGGRQCETTNSASEEQQHEVASGLSENVTPQQQTAASSSSAVSQNLSGFFTCAVGAGSTMTRRSLLGTTVRQSTAWTQPVGQLEKGIEADVQKLSETPSISGVCVGPIQQEEVVQTKEEAAHGSDNVLTGSPTTITMDAETGNHTSSLATGEPALPLDTTEEPGSVKHHHAPADSNSNASLVLLGETWARYEDIASETARQASAMARASRCLLGCTPVLRALRCAHERAAFLFSGSPSPQDILSGLVASLRAIKSTRPGCQSLLDVCAGEAAREVCRRMETGETTQYPTMFIEMEPCEDAVGIDCSAMCTNVARLREILETEVSPHAANALDPHQPDWAAFSADASLAQTDLESSVVQSLHEYREACAAVFGTNSTQISWLGRGITSIKEAPSLAASLPSPASFFGALLSLAGDLDTILESHALPSQSDSQRKASAPSSASASTRRRAHGSVASEHSRPVGKSLSSTTTPGSISRKRTASRDIQELQASVMAGQGIINSLVENGSDAGQYLMEPSCISPRVAALLAESERLIQEGRTDLGGGSENASQREVGRDQNRSYNSEQQSSMRNAGAAMYKKNTPSGVTRATASTSAPQRSTASTSAPQRSTFSAITASQQHASENTAQSTGMSHHTSNGTFARPPRGVDMVRAAHLLRAARELARRRELEGLSSNSSQRAKSSRTLASNGSQEASQGNPAPEASSSSVALFGLNTATVMTSRAKPVSSSGGRSSSLANAACSESVPGLEVALEKAARLRASLNAARLECEVRQRKTSDRGGAQDNDKLAPPQPSGDEASPAHLAEVWRSLGTLGPLDPGSDLGVAAALASAGNSPSGPLVRGLRDGTHAFQALPSGLAPPPPVAPSADMASGGQGTTLRLLEPLMPAPLGLALRRSQVLRSKGTKSN